MTVDNVCVNNVVTAEPDETIREAARRMRDKHVGALVVTDTQRRVVGILTDRDIVVGPVVQASQDLGSLRVAAVMTRDVTCVRRTESLDDAVRQMRSRGIRRLPVVGSDGQLEGLLTFDDVIRLMTSDLVGLVGLMARQQAHERDVRR